MSIDNNGPSTDRQELEATLVEILARVARLKPLLVTIEDRDTRAHVEHYLEQLTEQAEAMRRDLR